MTTIRATAEVISVGTTGSEQDIYLSTRVTNGPGVIRGRHVAVPLPDTMALWVAQRLLNYLAFRNSKQSFHSNQKLDAALAASVAELVEAARTAAEEEPA